MTNAMITMLRELIGYQNGNVIYSGKGYSLIVSKADRTAAFGLEAIGIVNVISDGRRMKAVLTAPPTNKPTP